MRNSHERLKLKQLIITKINYRKRYMLLTSDTRKSLIDALSLNMYAERNMGYAFGKTGIALTLLNVAHKFGRQYEYLEDHAVSLLEETLAVNIEQPTFANGNAGIGFALNHIIDNRLIDADYADLFSARHENIVSAIKNLTYNENDSFDYADYLFFIGSVGESFADSDMSICQNRLVSLINKCFDTYESRLDTWQARNMYYVFSIRLMAVINALQSYRCEYAEHFFDIILRNAIRLHDDDYICPYSVFYIYLYLTELHLLDSKYTDTVSRMFEECLKNIIAETLSFRELIDVVYLLSRIRSLPNNVYGAALSEKVTEVLSKFTDDDKNKMEYKLKRTLFDTAGYNLGIYGGLCRLLILDCFWDDMSKGDYPERMTELFL